jgi:hypothetical protein
MRNVRSTCESMAQHTSPNSSRALRDADEYPAITVDLSEWSAIRKLTRDQLRRLLALRAGPAYDSKLLFPRIPTSGFLSGSDGEGRVGPRSAGAEP